MEEVLKAIEKRRSCKRYKTDQLVPKDVIEKIVHAGTLAANGKGLQSPIIVAVTNREVRDRLSEMNATVLGSKSDPFYGAPQVLVVLADKTIGTRVYDGSLVMGNMMLAAEALGVSSCWIHRAKEVFETPEGKEILRNAGVEGEFEGIGNLVIGYDDNGKKPCAARKDNYVFWIE